MKYFKNFSISENKAIEIDLFLLNNIAEWFALVLETRSNQDHYGMEFRFELLRIFYFSILLYDKRHLE